MENVHSDTHMFPIDTYIKNTITNRLFDAVKSISCKNTEFLTGKCPDQLMGAYCNISTPSAALPVGLVDMDANSCVLFVVDRVLVVFGRDQLHNMATSRVRSRVRERPALLKGELGTGIMVGCRNFISSRFIANMTIIHQLASVRVVKSRRSHQ